MKQFDISYKYRDNFHAILVEAETADEAKAYFEEYKPGVEILGDVIEHRGSIKPGMPMLTVPEEWEPERDEITEKLEALKAHLIKEENFTEEEAAEATYDERYNSFECGSWEYKVFTDEEADEATREYILESLWAFNADFILRHTKFFETSTDREDREFTLALQALQCGICESANPIVEALIADKESFVEDAIDADGRGHFLSTYDGEEIDLGEFYAYRVN